MSQPVGAVLTRPTVTIADASEILRRYWAIEGTLWVLPSERDRNFRVAVEGDSRFVLKVSNLAEDEAFLDLQHMAMTHLASYTDICQRPVTSSDGRLVVGVGEGGGPPLARVLTWLPGVPLAEVRPDARTNGLYRHLGSTMGAVAAALSSVDGPFPQQQFQWDALRYEAVIATHADAVTDRARRAVLDRVRSRLAATLGPRLGTLRQSVIHNDANDHNVLVDPDAQRVTGLLDFGDMVHSVSANEGAVTAAYALLGCEDPLGAVEPVIAGFNDTFMLADGELEVVFELVIARLATSVALSAHQGGLDPSDAYLTVSEGAAWSALEGLLAIEPLRAAGRLAEACR